METYLALANESDPMGDGVRDHVEREFRSYPRCGIPAHGFARARCATCGYDFLVAFSCKGRGACPSWNAKRMAETAAHLLDHVIPHFHLHLCVVDGLFHRVEDDTNQDPANPETSLRFHEATALAHELPSAAGGVKGVPQLGVYTQRRASSPKASRRGRSASKKWSEGARM